MDFTAFLLDTATIAVVEKETGLKVKSVLSHVDDIQEAIELHYDGADAIDLKDVETVVQTTGFAERGAWTSVRPHSTLSAASS